MRVDDPPSDEARELLNALARAALREYVSFFGERRIPGGVRDFRERRLASLLVADVPGATDEDVIASLFAFTPRQAQGLLAGARARFRDELRTPVANAVRASLAGEGRSGRLDNERVWFRAPSSVASVLRELLASAPEAQTPIISDRETAGTYTTHRHTLAYLCDRLEIPQDDVAALSGQ